MPNSEASRNSKYFVVTLDPKADNFEIVLKGIRDSLRKCGRGIRVRGRLGRNNPNRGLYAVGGPLWRCSSQDIRIEHSVRVDVYRK